MKIEYVIHEDEGYKLAEEQARQYFYLLNQDLKSKVYQSALSKDLQNWQHNHTRRPSILSMFTRKGMSIPQKLGTYQYIQSLNSSGKLDEYLERSIFYIFLRDLAMDVHSPDTINSVQHAVKQIKEQLLNSSKTKLKDEEIYSLVGIYRLAEKYQVESTMVWLLDKMRIISAQIPASLDKEKAMVKIFKIIAGVVVHHAVQFKNYTTPEERAFRLDLAIRVGYAYGITYPFIDDLLDSRILTSIEEKKFTHMVRSTLIAGRVPINIEWEGPNQDLIQFIYSELKESFIYIENYLPDSVKDEFFQQAYIFFQAQEEDRNRELDFENYSNEQIYVPIILKSAYSRILAHSIIGTNIDEGSFQRTFYYGLYNQLSDDLRDLFKDLEEERLTPFTYYWKHHENRTDLVNPYEMYWTVVYFLIHDVYESNEKVVEAILNRAINGLRRLQSHIGVEKYNQVRDLFIPEDNQFYQSIQKLVIGAKDTDFFDQLISDQFYNSIKMEGKAYRDFLEKTEKIRNEVNDQLNISNNRNAIEENITDAANYTLNSGGKRLRPILTWLLGEQYGLKKSTIIQLVKSLEYMHTASLVFDDLPSQDNALIRRGRPTLHQVYNVYTAELTGLFLTQKAVEEQTFVDEHDSKLVLKLIRYSTQATAEMCKGQAMDLDSTGKTLTLEELYRMSFYKTGLGFEVPLVMPAILARASTFEISALKKFSLHLGIAFQIKDDLLDFEGDGALLGKEKGKDKANKNSTFVTVLGIEGAKKAMWEQYCLAMETLRELPSQTSFLKHLVHYVVHRNH